jgi:hypothetical protein
MGNFKKAQLLYKYNWNISSGDNPNETDSPDNDVLNRNEGYEMLSFINYFMVEYSLENIATFHKIEKLINEYLPSQYRSRENIKKWLLDNWKNY